MNDSEKTAPVGQKLLAALAYGTASTVIMLVNKEVLTQYAFPSYLLIALLQSVVSVFVLLVQWTQMPVLGSAPAFAPLPGDGNTKCSSSKKAGSTTQFRFPLFNIKCLKQVMPLPIVFVLNTASGLGATQKLNMPLFVLLRRFSIVMTLILEIYLLRKHFSHHVKMSVFLMVLGAMITASVDITYEWSGVLLILLNDAFTAAQGVGLRKTMDDISQLSNVIANHLADKETLKKGSGGGGGGAVSSCSSSATATVQSGSDEALTPDLYLGSAGIMYYNSLLSIPLISLLFIFHPVELSLSWGFTEWSNPLFLVCLMGSGGMGFVLNYSYYWCTRVNSPLTTTVIGALKNIFTTYAGMLFRDFKWNAIGFVGINVSVIGSLYYNKLEWDKMRQMELDRKLEAQAAVTREMEDGN